MEQNSEDSEVQSEYRKSRKQTEIPNSDLWRKKTSDRNRLMSDSTTMIFDCFDNKYSRISIEPKLKESRVGRTISESLIESHAIFTGQKYFLICNSCFWCASYFRNYISFTSCPACYRRKVVSLPIGEDENHEVIPSLTKGVELKFSTDIGVKSGQ